MKKLFIFAIFLVLISQNSQANPSSAKSKIKTIKFHKAETEAEKALDRILMIDQDLEEGTNDNVFTEALLDDEYRQYKDYQSLGPREDEPYRMTSEHTFTQGHDQSTNIGFLYYTIYSENNLIYIYTISRDYKENHHGSINEYSCSIEDLKQGLHDGLYNYAMKKEDDIWRIDGVCLGYVRINHTRCKLDRNASYYKSYKAYFN